MGANITECPQAGLDNQSLRETDRDTVERVSDRGDDVRLNQDYACMPQDEMSIAVNPTDTDNVFGGANDYRLGWGSSGFYVTTDRFGAGGHGHDHSPSHDDDDDRGGQHYDGIAIFPTPGSYPTPQAPKDHLDGGGDPIAIFDSGGTAYYGQIHFERENDTGGIFVNRSTNGGFTWSRPCIPNVAGVCGGNGDPRQPGDGVVTFNPDDDGIFDGSIPFDDKPYGTAGPRPDGVAAQCFTPSHTPTPCPAGHAGPDRVYITWTRFSDDGAEIMLSYSDDRARSWSMATVINGSAAFCVGGANGCVTTRARSPSSTRRTAISTSRSRTSTRPTRTSTCSSARRTAARRSRGRSSSRRVRRQLPDLGHQQQAGLPGPWPGEWPLRADEQLLPRQRTRCSERGQAGRRVRQRPLPGHRGQPERDEGQLEHRRLVLQVDQRRDDLDRADAREQRPVVDSGEPQLRACGSDRPARPTSTRATTSGSRGWTSAGAVGSHGTWQDRRLDTTSPIGVGEWPTSKTRVGNYIAWYWGGRCRVAQTGPIDQSSGRQCVHPGAPIITQPQGPVDPPDEYLDPAQSVFPFRNFGISDVPYNWDYCFRAGIFCGDYENVVIDTDNNVWAMWTDARNGRSSRMQTGRNPACEQSDAWADTYDDNDDADGQDHARSSDSNFWVTPCPIDEDD